MEAQKVVVAGTDLDPVVVGLEDLEMLELSTTTVTTGQEVVQEAPRTKGAGVGEVEVDL